MLKQKIVSITTSLVMLSGLALSSQSYASPPYSPDLVTPSDRWKLTLYWDRSATHDKIPFVQPYLCFKDLGADDEQEAYKWEALPANLGSGTSTQEGDQIITNGKLFGFNFDMQWEIYTRDEGAGHIRAWHPNNPSNGFTLNITMKRDAKPCPK
jgi:hypothetical protein